MNAERLRERERERKKIECDKEYKKKEHDAHCATSKTKIKRTNKREQTSPVEYKHIQELTNNSSVS